MMNFSVLCTLLVVSVSLITLLETEVFAETQQHLLKVDTQPKIFYISGAGLYDEGDTAVTGKAPLVWNEYRFIGWKVDGTWYADNPVTLTMDRAHEVVALYEKGTPTSKVTIDTIPREANIVVDDIIYTPSDFPLNFYWEEGTEHSIELLEKTSSNGIRYVLDSWNDQNISQTKIITVGEEDINLVGILKSQYKLTLLSEHGEIEGSGWYDKGTVVDFEVWPEEIFDRNDSQRKFVFESWDRGDYRNSISNSVIMEKPLTVKANWDEYFWLDLKSTSNDVNLSGTGWYPKGQKVALSAYGASTQSSDTQSEFLRWENTGEHAALIDRSDSITTSVILNNPATITAVWKNSYFVNVVSPYGTTLGGGYYDEGEYAEISIKSTEIEVQQNRMKVIFDGWETGDASIVALDESEKKQYSENIKILVDSPMTILANWKTMYYLDLQSDRGLPTGDGWYEENTIASIGLEPPKNPAGMWVRYVPEGWRGDHSSEATSANVIMNKPKALKAMWREDASPAIVNSSVLLGIGITGFVVYDKTQKKNILTMITQKLSKQHPPKQHTPKQEPTTNQKEKKKLQRKWKKSRGKRNEN